MVEDAICESDITGEIYTKQQNKEVIKRMKLQFPDWHHVVHDVTPHVYQDAGYAHVFVYHSICECPPGVNMPHFSNWEWRLQSDGKWRVVGYRCFNVPPAGDGGDGIGCGVVKDYVHTRMTARYGHDTRIENCDCTFTPPAPDLHRHRPDPS